MTRLMRRPELWVGKRIPVSLDFEHLPYDRCDECGRLYPADKLAGFLYPVSEADFALLDALGIDEALAFCPSCRAELEFRAVLERAEAALERKEER